MLATTMFAAALLAASDVTAGARNALPNLIKHGGLMIWVLMAASTLAILVFIERLLHYHRAQINSMEFLNGVRNVLKRDNIVEALSICDATPGPVARLVKVAILNRERGREGVREALEEAGMIEVPRLEEKLNVLATLAQFAPLLGLLGTILGFLQVFAALQAAGVHAHMEQLAGGIWKALISTAAGIAVAIPCYAAYNYLVGRVNSIVLDMEKAASEIVNIVTETSRADAGEAA
jgi:biopolymer transport protein ExbB